MSDSPLDAVFAALADPTRRRLLQHLIEQGPDTATRLAADSPMTRQAVVKHLRALVDSGLAAPQRMGREVRYVATPEPLATAARWLLEASPAWDRRLDKLIDASRARSAAAPTHRP